MLNSASLSGPPLRRPAARRSGCRARTSRSPSSCPAPGRGCRLRAVRRHDAVVLVEAVGTRECSTTSWPSCRDEQHVRQVVGGARVGVDVDVLGVRRRDSAHRTRLSARAQRSVRDGSGSHGVSPGDSRTGAGGVSRQGAHRDALVDRGGGVAARVADHGADVPFAVGAQRVAGGRRRRPRSRFRGSCAVLEPRQARSPSDAGSSSLTFRTRTR